MFFKKEMRPQTAGAPMPESKWTNKLSSVMFSASSADSSDFGSFGDEPERPSAPSGHATNKKKVFNIGGFSFDMKTLIVAAVAAVVVLALVIVLIVALFSGSGDIEFENNAYMTYVDGQGSYHVLANGDLVDHVFEGEVELIPADDNSFAYVFDNAGDGVYMYILNGKKLDPVSDNAVEGYVATAGLEPGIVFTENASSGLQYMLYNEKFGIDIIVKESKDPDDFVISGDGNTVAYTIADDDSDDRILYIYEDGIPELVTNTSCAPVALSNYGDYIYIKRQVEGVNKLYVRDMKKKETYPVNNSDKFLAILEMNVKGDEVIFCTGEGPEDIADLFDGDIYEVTSYLYRHKASEEDSTTELGPNYVTSVSVDGSIAVNKTFADKYFETTVVEDLDADKYTYHLTKKYVKETLCKYSGKFDPDGDYFYYLNSDDELIQLDLGSKNRDTSYAYNGRVMDFAVTEKGNVYLIDDGHYLWYVKASTLGKERPASYATAMSFYNGSNKVYFSEEEAEVIYISEEGSDKDIAKFGSSELTAVPYFSNQNNKKCYAVVYDETKESYSIFYTSNGNSFKMIKDVNDCDEIVYGIEIPEAIEW
ncbi:MAG: hypothetical protein IJ011_03725 [Clostridia bacterium]|nr:hypothetical protein [Clostridia bacterium]